MATSSREFIKKDDAGFYYYDNDSSTHRLVYIRSVDLVNILGISRKGTVLENVYIDLHNAILLSMENDRNPSLAVYINDKFHNAIHNYLIVPSDLANADDNWSGLI